MKAKWLLAVLLISPIPSGAVLNQPGHLTYGGQGTAIRASVLGVAIVIADSGPLPRSGGNQEAAFLKANVPGLLAADVLRSGAVGENDGTYSEASVTNFNITVEGNSIAANLLLARAVALCASGDPSVSSGTEILGLVINGQTIVVSGAPNQHVALPNGQIVLNEQESYVAEKAARITVTALHVVIKDMADLRISTAHASITADEDESENLIEKFP